MLGRVICAITLFFTCRSLADGLADAVERALLMRVEEPLPFVTRTPFWSAFVIFALHRRGARVEHGLGTAALLEGNQQGVCSAPLGVVSYRKTACSCHTHAVRSNSKVIS